MDRFINKENLKHLRKLLTRTDDEAEPPADCEFDRRGRGEVLVGSASN